jgi:hypothetical protein
MKTINNLLTLSCLLLVLNLPAGNDTTSYAGKSDEIVKQGWNFGVLPAISFDNDLGFQYGGLINLYHFGDGSRYPVYNHSIYLEVSAYTLGSGIYRFAYHSDRLIPNIELFVDVSYIPNQAYNFFGWNGYEAVYNRHWEDDTRLIPFTNQGFFTVSITICFGLKQISRAKSVVLSVGRRDCNGMILQSDRWILTN